MTERKERIGYGAEILPLALFDFQSEFFAVDSFKNAGLSSRVNFRLKFRACVAESNFYVERDTNFSCVVFNKSFKI